MDGRRLRLWVSGGLAAAALGCHKQSTHPGGFNFPKPGETTAAVLPGGSPSSSSLPKAPSEAPPPELVAQPAKPAPKKGASLKPETDVAIADLRLEAAFSPDRQPGDRQALLDQARQMYQKALKADPKNKAALLGLARFYGRVEEKDKAVEAYRKYLADYPTEHETIYEVAKAHARWGDWTGACEWTEAALKADPENRAYRKSLGFFLAHAGKWDEGFKAFCQVMPEAQARYNMAKVLQVVGQGALGRQQLGLALQLDPGFEPAREFLAELDGKPAGTLPAGANPVRPVVHVEAGKPNG